MKRLSAILLFTILACQPKTKVVTEQQTTYENKTEKFNTPDTLKSIAFKNDEGVKDEILKVDSLKRDLTKERPFVEADASFQWDANQKLEKLLKHFGKHIPDYYGGAFINDNGNLVINIKGNLKEGKSKISKIIGVRNIIFQSAKHSLSELNRIMDIINKSFDTPVKKQYTKNIMSASSYEDKGYVEVGLKDNSPEKQKEFREHIVDSPLLRFVESGPMILQ